MIFLEFLFAFVIIYSLWSTYIGLGNSLRQIGKENDLEGIYFFNRVLLIIGVSLIFARVGHILINDTASLDLGLSLLPYTREGRNFIFFEYYPWRILRVSEGVNKYIFFALIWILNYIVFVKPIHKLILNLNIERISVKFKYSLRLFVGVLIFTIYTLWKLLL